jgi:hypothetical protein
MTLVTEAALSYERCCAAQMHMVSSDLTSVGSVYQWGGGLLVITSSHYGAVATALYRVRPNAFRSQYVAMLTTFSAFLKLPAVRISV